MTVDSMADQMRAASANPPPSGIDLAEVISRGRQRRRLRRVGMSGLAMLAVVGVLGGATMALDRGRAAAPLPVGGSASPVSSATASPQPSPSASADPHPNGLLAGKTFPYDAYQLSEEQMRLVSNAQSVLANKCMTDLGFPAALRYERPRPELEYEKDSRRYGITDPDIAATRGYHLIPQPRPTSTTGRLTHKLSEGEHTALYGKVPPEGGCLGDAGRQLHADSTLSAMDAAFAPLPNTFGNAEKDPRVQAKIQEWIGCMANHGYQEPGFWDRTDDSRFMKDEQPSPEEIQTAVTDVACKAQVGLVATWYDVEVGMENAQIQAHQARFDRAKRLRDALLDRAEQVLAEAGQLDPAS